MSFRKATPRDHLRWAVEDLDKERRTNGARADELRRQLDALRESPKDYEAWLESESTKEADASDEAGVKAAKLRDKERLREAKASELAQQVRSMERTIAALEEQRVTLPWYAREKRRELASVIAVTKNSCALVMAEYYRVAELHPTLDAFPAELRAESEA